MTTSDRIEILTLQTALLRVGASSDATAEFSRRLTAGMTRDDAKALHREGCAAIVEGRTTGDRRLRDVGSALIMLAEGVLYKRRDPGMTDEEFLREVAALVGDYVAATAAGDPLPEEGA